MLLITNKNSYYIQLIRPYQWLKNLLLFCPVFFSGNLQWTNLISVSLAVVGFSLISSIGYIVNDWIDRKSDSFHPEKKHRPISSGNITGKEALLLFGVLTILSMMFFGTVSFPVKFQLIVALYLTLTISYSLYLKSIVLLEIFAVSMGFVLRVIAGGIVCSIEISSWLFLTIFFISMLISVAKRFSEYTILGERNAISHRKSQQGYSISYLENMIWACGSVTLVVYSLYAVEHGGLVVYSVLPASYGIIRFIFLTDQGKGSDPIKTLIKDRQLLLSTLVFLLFLSVSIYTNSIKSFYLPIW